MSHNFCNYLIEPTPTKWAQFGKWILRPNAGNWGNYTAIWADSFEEIIKYMLEFGGKLEQFKSLPDGTTIYFVTLP